MSLLTHKFASRALLVSAFFSVVACSQQPGGARQVSQPLVTEVEHTIAKRQSIGNCWLYAQATWLESLTKTALDQEIDVSESYWTWWHWYDQIVDSGITDLETGGWWSTGVGIFLEHGYVAEGQLIPEEDGAEMSARQAHALAYINTQLKEGGSLETFESRTPDKVRAELDKAFGVEMAAAEALAVPTNEAVIDENGTTAFQALAGGQATRWNTISFPRVYGRDTVVTLAQEARRKALFKRVLRALNDKKPVVMSLMIDFNALDTQDATFKASRLQEVGIGSQGGHMVVLDDYTVDNAPGYGFIGEGEVPDEMKAAALEGDLLTLVAKNSWGRNRPDRGLTDGYTRFDFDYLTKQLEWTTGGSSLFYTTLSDFVLPPGY